MRQCKYATWALGALGLLGGALAPADSFTTSPTGPDDDIAHGLERYLQARAARFIDWLPDGAMLVATRFGDTRQVHRVRAPLAAREQQSFEPAGVLLAAAQPQHGGSFLYLAPRGAGAGTALLWQRQAGAPALALTEGDRRVEAAQWSHDGARIAVSVSPAAGGTDRRSRAIDLIDTGVDPPATRRIAGGAGVRWRIFGFSPDDRRLLLGRETLSTDAAPGNPAQVPLEPELYLADLAGGDPTPVLLHPDAAGKARGKPRHRGKGPPSPQPAVRSALARFAPDGRGILFIGSAGSASGGPGSDFRQLWYLDPGSGEARLLSDGADHDVDLFDESPDGHYLAYAVDADGWSRLTVLDQQRRLELNPDGLPAGVIGDLKFDPSGERLAVTLESARAPGDVYVLEPGSGALTRWTQSELGPLDPAVLIEPTPMRFETWDRLDDHPRTLPGFVYRLPETSGAGAAAPHPVLILLRSGAGAQYRPHFEPLIQYLTRELGFVVVAPNVRGASGFGRRFEALGEGALREDAQRDVGALLVWIGQQRGLDFNHIVILGEGSGGELALASLGQYGDRLRGGAALFPPAIDPLSSAVSIRRPVLLVYGSNDPDAPGSAFERLAGRLRTSGAQVQTLAVAEQHGDCLRRSDRDAWALSVARFFSRLVR
jgi:dipeptidyl aminopeptidase/acylaminoacyl peptidase